MAAPVLAFKPEEWWCPNCKVTDTIPHNPAVHVRYHTCPKLRYLSAPMVRRGIAAKVELHERESYVGNELVQYDPEQGRPIVSIETTRDEGNDLVVFAPTARAEA